MLNVEIRDDDAKLDNILDLLEEIIPDLNIQRIDHENNFISIIADIKIADSNSLRNFNNKFQSSFPSGQYSIIDDSSFPNE